MKIFAGALFTNKKKKKQDGIRKIPIFVFKYLKKSEQIRTNQNKSGCTSIPVGKIFFLSLSSELVWLKILHLRHRTERWLIFCLGIILYPGMEYLGKFVDSFKICKLKRNGFQFLSKNNSDFKLVMMNHNSLLIRNRSCITQLIELQNYI